MKESKHSKLKDLEFQTATSLLIKANNNKLETSIFKNDKFIHMINEKAGKNLDLNDYINSQISLLKFIKECINV